MGGKNEFVVDLILLHHNFSNDARSVWRGVASCLGERWVLPEAGKMVTSGLKMKPTWKIIQGLSGGFGNLSLY